MDIVKIGNVELTTAEAARLYIEDKYIVTFSKVYSIEYSMAQKRYYGRVVYAYPGMAKRGRFHALTAKEVNHLIGHPLLIERS